LAAEIKLGLTAKLGSAAQTKLGLAAKLGLTAETELGLTAKSSPSLAAPLASITLERAPRVH
jgi:hypothetical protein